MGDNQQRDAGSAAAEHPHGQGGSPGAARPADDDRDSVASREGAGGAGADGVHGVDPKAGLQREVGDIEADDPQDGSLPGRMGGGLAGG